MVKGGNKTVKQIAIIWDKDPVKSNYYFQHPHCKALMNMY